MRETHGRRPRLTCSPAGGTERLGFLEGKPARLAEHRRATRRLRASVRGRRGRGGLAGARRRGVVAALRGRGGRGGRRDRRGAGRLGAGAAASPRGCDAGDCVAGAPCCRPCRRIDEPPCGREDSSDSVKAIATKSPPLHQVALVRMVVACRLPKSVSVPAPPPIAAKPPPLPDCSRTTGIRTTAANQQDQQEREHKALPVSGGEIRAVKR